MCGVVCPWACGRSEYLCLLSFAAVCHLPFFRSQPPMPHPQLKAKSGHNGDGLLLQSPAASDSPSMPAQGGIMAPVALRAAYPGSDLSDAGLNSIMVPQGMIPTLDEQPEENDDVEDGIVLAQAYEIDYQMHQSRNIMHAHAGLDPAQTQYAMQGMGMMGMMSSPTVVMSYTAPLRPRGMPSSHVMPLAHVPMHGQYMNVNGLSMGSNVPRDMQSGSHLIDDSIRCQSGFMGLNEDLVRSHSPGLVNGINFFADDPQ